MPNSSVQIIPVSSEIKIENYVIGYKEEGESIIVFLKLDDEILFSMVVDSYENNINHTIKILEDNKIENIDILCWTHPHEDHSKGIEKIILKYCNKNTKVVIPEIDSNKFEYIPDSCREIYKNISKINYHGKKKNGNLTYGFYSELLKWFKLSWKGKEIPFSLFCLTPPSKNIANSKFNRSIAINDFSISLLLSFANRNFLYGGDIENKSISYLIDDNNYIDNLSFIKVPHHGSSSSNKLFEMISIDENTVCAITNYHNGYISLPESEIIDKYYHCSNEVFVYDEKNEYDYGILKSVFTISEPNIIINDNTYEGIVRCV